MKKRKPFFIKGNFQLKVILCFVVLLAAGISSAVIFIYRSLKDIIEEAAFSAHLSLESSGELFLRTILEVNLLTATISLLGGLLIIICLHFYLEAFFYSFKEGLERLAKGDFSFRMRVKNKWLGRQLLNDFNIVATNLEKRSKEIKELMDSLITVVNSDEQKIIKKIKTLHSRLRQIKCP